MPAAELEQSPIDFNHHACRICAHPSIRIDANVQRFDVEVS